MAWMFADDDRSFGRKPYGFLRYRQVLEREWKRFFLADLLALAGILPAGIGIAWAVLSQSILVLFPACLLGGLLAGPALSCMCDCILRCLRDCRDDLWPAWKRALKVNFKASLVPGMLLTLAVGVSVFSAMLFYWSEQKTSAGTLLVWFASMVITMVLFETYWPQLVLFEQKPGIRLKNCLLFTIQNFWRVTGVAALQVIWWILGALLLPWTAFLVPFLGIWVILYVSIFLLYNRMDIAFGIEEQIEEHFPGQIDEDFD